MTLTMDVPSLPFDLESVTTARTVATSERGGGEARPAGILILLNENATTAGWGSLLSVDGWIQAFSLAVMLASPTFNLSPVPATSTDEAAIVNEVCSLLGDCPHERIAGFLGVSRQTLHKWLHGERMTDEHRQRLLAVRDVLQRAAEQVTPVGLCTWLDAPRGPEGVTPSALLEDGNVKLARLVAASTPSFRLKAAPDWIRRPEAEPFQAGGERLEEAVPPSWYYTGHLDLGADPSDEDC